MPHAAAANALRRASLTLTPGEAGRGSRDGTHMAVNRGAWPFPDGQGTV